MKIKTREGDTVQNLQTTIRMYLTNTDEYAPYCTYR